MSNLDFVSAQTTARLAEVYQKPVPPLSMAATGFPLVSDGLENIAGAKRIEVVGTEDVIPDDATVNEEGNIFLTVGTQDSSMEAKVRNFVAAAKYSRDLVRESSLVGRDLPGDRVDAAFRAIQRHHDAMSWRGAYGASDSFARSTAITQATDLTTKWTANSVNAAALYTALANFVNSVIENSSGIFRATDLAVTLGVFNKATTALMSGQNLTVAGALQQNLGITIRPIFDLKNRGDAGQDGRAVAYARTPDAGRNLLLIPEQILGPFESIEGYEAGVEGKSAGFIWLHAMAARYIDNTG